MNNPKRDTYLRFHIDTNRINAKNKLPNMKQLERWHKDHVIMLEMSEPSRREALSGSNKTRHSKTEGYGYSLTLFGTGSEQNIWRKIEKIIFPNGVVNENQKNDVEIVFNAQKYNRILITKDGGSSSQPGGILGNREKIKNQIGVTILTDEEAVDLVRKRIHKRDDLAIKLSEKEKIDLPDWVGKD